MNPTGNTTADMIFTGLLLVLHLAALAGLGYFLGRLMGDRRAKTADELANSWKLRAWGAMEMAQAAEEQTEHAWADSNAVRAKVRQEFRDLIAASQAAREGMAEGYRDEIRHLSAQLADLRNLASAAWQVRQGQRQRAHDEAEWCAGGQTVSYTEMAAREKVLDDLLALLHERPAHYQPTEDTGEPD